MPKITKKRYRLSARRLADEGNAEEAHQLYVNSSQRLGHWDLPEALLLGLIAGLDRGKRYDAMLPMMTDYTDRFPNGSVLVRLKLAQLPLEREKRPAKALRILDAVNPAELTERMQLTHAKLRAQAERLATDESTELELADE